MCHVLVVSLQQHSDYLYLSEISKDEDEKSRQEAMQRTSQVRFHGVVRTQYVS